jgi:acyl-CoA thioester hydrolase
MKERQGSTFIAECHVRYLREIRLGDPVVVAVWLIAADDKRLHSFEELRHAGEGWISATSEGMSVHIDMARRKVAPFPPDIQANIGRVLQAHAALPRPDGLGRAIGMPAKR